MKLFNVKRWRKNANERYNSELKLIINIIFIESNTGSVATASNILKINPNKDFRE